MKKTSKGLKIILDVFFVMFVAAAVYFFVVGISKLRKQGY